MSKRDEYLELTHGEGREELLHSEMAKLADLICNHAPHDGTFGQRIPGLHIRIR